MVETYVTGGGSTGLSAKAALGSQHSGCGYYTVLESCESDNGRLKVTRRPKVGLVSVAYIWLKRQR